MHERLILVGHIGRMHAEPREKPTAQENAAEVRKHPAAKAFVKKAPHEINLQDDTAGRALDPCLSDPKKEWEDAFPGQRVHRHVPNQQRLALHFARGMVRAVARGDFEVATVYFGRLYGTQRSTTKGAA